MKLKGKTAVVTGGGSGIGEAISKRFAEEGAKVIILDYDRTKGAEVQAEIREKGGEVDYRFVDVSSMDSVSEAMSDYDDIDILVNNAGVSAIGDVENTSTEDMDRVYSVNIKGVFHCLKAIIPSMRRRGSGVILNLASIASKLGIQDRFAYSMSKGAVLTMTFSIARDYVSHGIRCNCICPARVHTPFVDDYLEKHYANNKKEMFKKLSDYQPIGRMGKPSEIAALATFLCSDEASFITGSAYDIDGGVMNLR